MEWGLLGSEALAEGRRTRTLGLGSVVRKFNVLAVPGLGGIWFGKQLFLSALGIHVAEKAQNVGKRVQNIEVANAVEALACWLALKSNGWNRDPRLRGATKMRDQSDLSFANVRKRNFYVTQPMRQATIQPLRALGLVESSGERFNAFRCSERGMEFIEAASDGAKPYHRSLLKHLVLWVGGEHDKVTSSPELTHVLSPLEPLPANARNILRERLIQGSDTDAPRRRRMLDWVAQTAVRLGLDLAERRRGRPCKTAEK